MNERIKKKKRKYYTTARQRKRNKALCKRYPFLIPRGFSDKPRWGRRYEYTIADDFPKGWWKSFGIMLCEELREDLIKNNCLSQYRIAQIKEKFGQLRLYDNGVPIGSNAWDIIEKYSVLSENICIKCGKPDVHMINCWGWISPYCLDCYKKIVRNGEKFRTTKSAPMTDEEIEMEYTDIIEDDSEEMANRYSVRILNKTEDKIEVKETDISETTNKIRKKWSKAHG